MEYYVLYFLIGHLIGDFFFQTGGIVQWKYSSVNGIFAHVFLVMLALVIVFFPLMSWNVVWYILLNGVFHTVTDILKVRYDITYKPHNPLPGFWTDQSLHIVVGLGTIPLFFSSAPEVSSFFAPVYLHIPMLMTILGILGMTYFTDIYWYLYLKKHGNTAGYERGYFAMFFRMAVFSFVFSFFWIFVSIFVL